MDIVSLVNLFDHPDQAPQLLGGWGLRDPESAWARLSALPEHGLTLDLLSSMCNQLSTELPAADEPDAVLEALVEFISVSRSPLALAALFQRDRQSLPMLLNVLKLGESWRKMLVDDPEAFDLLRMTDGQPVAATWLRSEVCGEMAHFSDERHILSGLRRIKQRELLRIVYGDVFKRHRFELVTEQLTILADALLEAALQAAQRKLQERGEAKRFSGATGRMAIIALGRLGGFETDYSHRLELLLVHEPLPDEEHAKRAAREYFDRLGRLVIRYLSESHEGQVVYNVEMPVGLEQQTGPAFAADEVFAYLDGLGRTWHREAAIKARAVAGDLDLGKHLLRQLQPWVYRRYLNLADESGTRALKRRLQRNTQPDVASGDPVAAIPQMTRQVERVMQFLQLLSGGDLPIARATNTLSAIAGLEQAGVLSVQERIALEDGYRLLRTAEHRLQLGSRPASEDSPPSGGSAERSDDQQSHENSAVSVADALRRTSETTSQLLASAFQNDDAPSREADLLLDPQPAAAEILGALAPYGFKDEQAAYHHLQTLANERVPFLSTRRCRFYLAAIAPQLLSSVASTPDPDYTLFNLSAVSDSIGSKGVLWELFNFNPPSLQLYVQLCAASPYLSSILTSHPGMVDELVDSLQLARLATRDELSAMLDDLTRGSRDPLSLLHGFKHSHHLQIGVRELLGKENFESTHRALSDVAEVCLRQIVHVEYEKLAEKFGDPMKGGDSSSTDACGYAVFATGELGAREANYQSDCELFFVYETDGMTVLTSRGRRESKTANSHFFSQLAQRVTKAASQLTPWGRLYNVEIPLRSPSGGLALSVAELRDRMPAPNCSLADWQTLAGSRPIAGSDAFMAEAASVVRDSAVSSASQISGATSDHLAQHVNPSPISTANLRKGPGGSRYVELLVAVLQKNRMTESPDILLPGTMQSLSALKAAGELSPEAYDSLSGNYRWLRQIESTMRLLSIDPRHDLTNDGVMLQKLALLLRLPADEDLAARTAAVLEENLQWIRQLWPQANTATLTNSKPAGA